ncbi:MAG TPA: hypothetical protein VF691_09545 [Cytophagaceae bacterium]|jgi:hypothetical protein
MNRQELAIATMSLARDTQEEELLRKSLKSLSNLNIPIFLTDGGSNEHFLEYVKNLPNITLLKPKQGLWNQTLSSLTAAFESNSKFILYTEPDKSDFFEQSVPTLIAELLIEEKTGIVMAARSKKGFGSFPAFQQMTETTINNCCKELIELETDYVYGPFFINRSVVPYLKALDAGIGWGWRPYAFHIAKRLGYNVSAYTGDFLCPEGQREDSTKERIYRMKQMNQNIEGLILAGTASIE